jgi:hypothetical protein
MMWRSKMQSFAITGNDLVSFGNHGHVCLRDVCRSIFVEYRAGIGKSMLDESSTPAENCDIRLRSAPGMKPLRTLRNRLIKNDFEAQSVMPSQLTIITISRFSRI